MKLLTKELRRSLPKLYSTENITDPEAQVKFFTPDANWTWYLFEYEDATKTAFGFVVGLENELGYFNLDELESLRGPLGLAVERDISFVATKLTELKKLHDGD